MADNIQKEKIDKFIQLTGADGDRAKFYLESSNWNYEVAVASFFDDDGDDDLYESAPAEPQALPSKPQSMDTSSFPPSSTRPSRFATLGNYQQESSSSSDEEGQAFYAGGSEHSGQQILGPKKGGSKKVVENLFKSAREHGAEEVDKSEKKKPTSSRAFKGSGYRLGETEDGPADIVQGAPLTNTPRQVDMVLKLWKDGFSVDDGELRDFHNEANKEFLDSVSKGEVPQELIRLARGGEVNLNMEDHRHEAYVKPKVAIKAFSGQGNMLGSPTPNIAVPSASAGASSAASGSRSSVTVDPSKPTTSLQIRLADGSRMVAKFNHSHRVSDIRQHIIANNPRYGGANFALMTTFPNKELTDENQTLEHGKLLNAVIVQRLK